MIRINNTQYFHFLQHANVLRRSGSLCDAVISVKSQIFRAHRLVLACASRALAQRLAQGDADSPVHCTLEYFSPHTFQQVLDFTYTQALDVPVDDLRLLLRAAQLLEMQQLEEQCRKQLDTLDCREAAQPAKEVKEEQESTEERNEDAAQGDKPQEASPPEEAEDITTVTKTLLLSDCQRSRSSPPSTAKKSRLSPMPALCRDSVITRPLAGSSSFSSPWTFSAHMRDSVSTLRRITENFISAHPLQYPHQASVANPFSLSTPHVFPLLGSHLQGPVQRYVMDCSSFHPRYNQNLYAESNKTSSALRRKQAAHRAFTPSAQSDKPRLVKTWI
uniref:BTB domain-containing protein n=1 Tax=Salarias fasciatus TaxID=181472 RepID=A0A672G1U5_SALFA